MHAKLVWIPELRIEGIWHVYSAEQTDTRHSDMYSIWRPMTPSSS
jgi:hypothetical protein